MKINVIVSGLDPAAMLPQYGQLRSTWDPAPRKHEVTTLTVNVDFRRDLTRDFH
jgi:hypothetical protein